MSLLHSKPSKNLHTTRNKGQFFLVADTSLEILHLPPHQPWSFDVIFSNPATLIFFLFIYHAGASSYPRAFARVVPPA